MILSPDDHRSLQAIDGELATCEPHLAAMFKIFTRLNAEEAPPPSEDQIVAVPPPAAAPAEPAPRGWRWWRQDGRGRRRARSRAAGARLSAGSQARARSPRAGGRPEGADGAGSAGGAGRSRLGAWRPVAAIGVPAVLLMTVLIVMFVTLTSSIKCRPAPATSGAGSAAPTAAPAMPGSAAVAACQRSMRTRG
jgi:hypothetical protein